jgi:Polyketide cyclase / dehydrase and lipid transport
MVVLSAVPNGGVGRERQSGFALARVEGETIINRPVEEVFDFVADERNEPRYNPRMRDAEQVSEGPIGVGTRFRTELETMGRTMPMVVEFTGFERPWRLGSVTRSSMMDTEGALTFEPVPGGTRMCWSWDVRPRGALKLMAPIVGVIGRRQEQSVWGNLKRLLESGGQRS